ncbi:PE family protein [Mycobacterium florentinum]|uniref:PE family protein n=1 Tax=Mycobacterium florentinum TaxID=292462 RepID=A0A1X1UF05_MYCFL|nr:PE/PPE C-terminal domain-containing protein [Mycobacterium florentinum]MCV7411546.1 PE domain-containing protein [Mycobacterium florentinum]ORV55402.1 PE family protein [Mycobacterium florentinum]BBX80908.1 PE family protein [Mycobacterium florentinum]
MSFLTTVTEELLAAQGQLEAINANLAAQNAGAAAATTVVAPAAADAVSLQQAAIFSAFGTTYQTTATDAQTQLETYTTNLGSSSTSYSDTEANNAASAALQSADPSQFSLLSDPISQVQAPGPGSTALDWLQYLLGGTGNFTNPTMLGGMFGLSGNSANILNIGGGNYASAASALLGMAGGGLLPAGSDTIGDAAAAAGAADLAASTTPMPVGMGGMAGAMPVVGIGQGTLVGNMSVPPSWVGSQVTPVVGTTATPLHTVGWTGAAPQAGTGTPMAGMPGMVTGAGRASSGFGAPRYGVKPIVMPKLTAV